MICLILINSNVLWLTLSKNLPLCVSMNIGFTNSRIQLPSIWSLLNFCCIGSRERRGRCSSGNEPQIKVYVAMKWQRNYVSLRTKVNKIVFPLKFPKPSSLLLSICGWLSPSMPSYILPYQVTTDGSWVQQHNLAGRSMLMIW